MRTVLLGLIVALLVSCGPGPVTAPTPAAAAAAAQDTLDEVRTAVLRHDRGSFARYISTRDPAFAATADSIFRSLSGLPLTRLALQLRPLGQDLTGPRRALLGSRAFVQQVAVSWQVAGDQGPAQHLLWLTFEPDPDVTTIAGTSDAPDGVRAEPLWLTGPVSVRQGSRVTLLGTTGRPTAAWVRRGEDAAAAVRRRLRAGAAADWNGDLVVELPATRQSFERVLGVAPGSYSQIAAVAWPEGPDPGSAAIRIVVNPEQTAQLDAPGLAVLLTHEAVHVATRSAASAAPAWLVEGLADYVAYASHPQTAPAAAAALLQRVRERGAPAAVPPDSALAPGAPDLQLSYAEAWTLCRFLAEGYSPERLERFYQAVSSGTAVSTALRTEFGLSTAELTSRWRASLVSAARDS